MLCHLYLRTTNRLYMTLSTRHVGAHSAPLIVHSHLRWDFVWQRPQQLMTRFAVRAPVFFLEEPVFADDIATPSLKVTLPHVNLYRAVPQLPSRFRESYDDAAAATRMLARTALESSGALRAMFRAPIQWFYTPMPAPIMLDAFNERGVVYDCMDELSKFRFAPPDLTSREQMLMENADVVFTGGHKLYQAKSYHHDNVHFFGCGVDSVHFGRARDSQTRVPADLAKLRGPIAGYYGVIDERLDYDLIDALAAARPEMNVVMIGPTAKVDPAALPQRPNLHWLGSRSYDELPAYVKGFDVCLMPFALNEATEYINPTKTLEYMAAGKPIVSTAVADVVHHFAPPVRVARDRDDFIARCRAATRSGRTRRTSRRESRWRAMHRGNRSSRP